MAVNDNAVNMSFRVDKAIKEEADELFNQMGMTTSAAINIFLRQAIHDWSMPFRPNARASRKFSRELKKALKEADAIKAGKIKAKQYNSFEEFLKEENIKL